MFTVEDRQHLVLEHAGSIAGMFTLSPYVWRGNEEYQMLLRAVNHAKQESDKVSRIYPGESTDGLRFAMTHTTAIAAGPDADDKDGAEDPTVVPDGDDLTVFYSGWNQQEEQGKLLVARGPDPLHLRKDGIAIPYSERFKNPKEASLAQCPDGTWRLFFEYAAGGASHVGVATAPSLLGPWDPQPDAFTTRASQWDSWHLSPGPILPSEPERPLMFYNGADREGVWRVGWITFDPSLTTVMDRGTDPVFIPPPPESGFRDAAFVSSAVEVDGAIWLYYSEADKDMVRLTLHKL